MFEEAEIVLRLLNRRDELEKKIEENHKQTWGTCRDSSININKLVRDCQLFDSQIRAIDLAIEKVSEGK